MPAAVRRTPGAAVKPPQVRLQRILLAGLCAILLAACTPVEPAEEPGAPLPTGDDNSPGAQPNEGSDAPTAEESGILRGQVSFYPAGPGPTQKDVTPEFPPEAFAGRSVSIFLIDEETLVAEEALTEKGSYEIVLPAGTYRIAITLVGIEQANSLPSEVVITAGAETVLDIVIDSGLR